MKKGCCKQLLRVIIFLSIIMPGRGIVFAQVKDLSHDPKKENASSFSYDAKGRRDPFGPLVRDGRVLSVVRVQENNTGVLPLLYGILWDAHGNSIALINDQEAQEGDAVGGYTIKTIHERSVVLMMDTGEEVVLELTFE